MLVMLVCGFCGLEVVVGWIEGAAFWMLVELELEVQDSFDLDTCVLKCDVVCSLVC